ncbi:DUF2064 domain-containing protein [Lapillicoccus jejuensis]|uniref:RSAM/selenodomain-associated transferase 1 n=1 Tax=Lapillicoccus jejuensis TaxID=402171 RepID=A0A542E2C8_9MICO|nr:DUF2064 domain-containing protein [Lapillicoccus jejuensis]TQJ09491.1 rSAM/selenodomain-associated transferase 1 [Lapillicoccus jejuensis]
MTPDTVVVLAKSPVPGRVKTRLTPTFSAGEAAVLATAALRDTLDVTARVGARRRVVAWDGPPVRWLPPDATVLPQRGDGLDERLEHVFADLLGDLAPRAQRPTLLVGMDTPQVTRELLRSDWDGADAVLGPSPDGGYWAVGLRRPVPGAFAGVPMSTPTTGARQLDRLRSLGLRVHLLPPLLDVDDPADAARVAAQGPGTRFARVHRRLLRDVDPGTLFEAALAGASVELLGADGSRRPLDAVPWQAMSDADELVVARCEPPVLDVGCGPGRFVGALAGRGLPVLGVDVSPAAVAATLGRGASALRRDVHGPLPGEGRWGTVLLADGNIGIGGDPAALLARCRTLLRPGALALVEVDLDEEADALTELRLVGPHGRRSRPVPWAVVGSRRLVREATRAGFVPVEEWRVAHRSFVALRSVG